MLRIGCHLSASKGYEAMAKTAVSIDAGTFQFFTRNPRGGKAKEIDEKDIEKYKEYSAKHDVCKILAHAPYTLNVCSADEGIRKFAIDTFADDMKRMEYTPGNCYNFHPGSHVGQGIETGIRYIVDALNEVIIPGQSTTILLETMAGKGSEVGSTFEQIRQIIDMVEHKEYLGVCLDTCHVWEAGYDIVSDLDGVVNKFDDIIGLDRLKAIHLNDSKNPIEAHKDRHERIGYGQIGMDAIVRIINHEKLRMLPFYLETPNEIEGYAEEIRVLKEAYRG